MRINWGIIGAGHIAREFADGVLGSETGRLLGVASRKSDKARDFAAEYGAPRSYGGYQALLDDPQIEAVYIATPHPVHAEWAIKAAEAKKHLLVEKPMGINRFETMAMIAAARANDVFLMEAFMYRCHPQTKRLHELIASGLIGEVQLIRASFAYDATGGKTERDQLTGRAFENDLAGGGILDVGCYPVSAARLIAGAAAGRWYDEPTEVKGVGHLGPTGVDHFAIASLKFPCGAVAELSTGVGLNLHREQTIQVWGTTGTLLVPDPWCPSRYNRDPTQIRVRLQGESEDRIILVDAPHDLYSYEADMVGRHLAERQAPVMTWDDSMGNIGVLDRWRAELGLVYESEKKCPPAGVNGRRPVRKPDAPMMYGRIPGLEKPVSRLVFGCDSNNTMPDTVVMLDDYFERGGNTFDTSYGYGNPNGATERNLGEWIRTRGVRDQVVVIEKGANYPNNTPEGLSRELLGGLERLSLDSVDIYMIHRDNPLVPIGEWLDVLNQHHQAGRMRIFGVSNFSQERLEAARHYAAEHGLQGFSAVSNNFALARMLEPVWIGCVSSSGERFRGWFEETQTPLLPWSSQGRGFFTPRASRNFTGNEEWTRCWYSEDNFARKDRANTLARDRGVEPINIALAYVLNQPFPTFPLVGPKQLSETASCLRALEISLTPEEVRWLDTGV